MRLQVRLAAVTAALLLLGGGLTAFFAATSTAGAAAGKTLVELDTDVAPDLDPDGSAPADPGFMTAELNMFDTLVNYPLKLVNGAYVPNYKVSQTGFAPGLATSYSHKGLVWTFNLRHGVKSCAGNTFTSADVVYTYARAKSASGDSAIAGFVGIVGGIFTPAIYGKNPAAKKLHGEVKALGAYKVQFTQTGPNALFPNVLTTWLGAPFDSKEMLKHATAADPWSHVWTNTTSTAGFGAYCLDQWTKGGSETFTVNPNYTWGPKPVYTKVIVDQVASDSERLAGLLNGTANIATALTPSELQRAGQDSSLNLLSWNNTANQVSLGINYKYPPFNDPTKTKLLRQAIAYALPYDAIGKEIYYGKFKQAQGEFASGFTDYVPVGEYKQNIAKAKALMAQAGFPNGKGLPANSPAFKLTYTAERASTLLPMANLISTALAQIGIHVTLNPIPAVQEISGETSKYNLGMFIRDGSRALVGDVGYATLLYFAPASIGGLSPSVNYDSPVVNKEYLISAKTVGAVRQAALTKVQQVAMADLSFIPIGSVASQLPVTKGITGWYGNVYDTLVWKFLK
jgi:peptide/nickel transport system substrate-binding protein